MSKPRIFKHSLDLPGGRWVLKLYRSTGDMDWLAFPKWEAALDYLCKLYSFGLVGSL